MKNISYSIVLLLIIILFTSSNNYSQQNQLKVETIDKIKLEKLIKERNGKFLLLNLWATWCAPCREEFPDLVKLSDNFKSKNLEVVGISMDYPEEINSKIIPFLKKQNVSFKNYVNGFEKDEHLINAIDTSWIGAIPATVIYDEKGKKVAFFEGKKSYDEFVKQISLVRKK
ncbi:MAG: TlpA family protein disulfide reductase [Melioribacteraceae bacterium]|nr:TlpA family protein disulfide reductase [Melioribacteraceae bacterium]